MPYAWCSTCALQPRLLQRPWQRCVYRLRCGLLLPCQRIGAHPVWRWQLLHGVLDAVFAVPRGFVVQDGRHAARAVPRWDVQHWRLRRAAVRAVRRGLLVHRRVQRFNGWQLQRSR